MRIIKILIVFVFLISCNNSENKINKKNAEKTSGVKLDSFSENKIEVKENIVLKDEIINNEFANAPLGEFDFNNHDLSLFFKGDYDVVKHIIVNKYNNANDTLIVYKKKKSIVRFYKTIDKIFLDSLDVSESEFISIKYGFDIGMNKDKVLSLLKVSRNDLFADTISVIDDEGTSSVKLLFAEKKLKRMIVLPW